MQGKLVKCLTGWKVFYNKYTGAVTQDPYHLLHNLPLHPDDTEDVESHWESLDEAKKKVAETIEFEVVKKFMADETLCYAKLTKETNKETLYTEEQVIEAVFMAREGLRFVDPSPLDRLIELIEDKINIQKKNNQQQRRKT